MGSNKQINEVFWIVFFFGIVSFHQSTWLNYGAGEKIIIMHYYDLFYIL